jgi:SAM-dependent methyltransferase
VLARKELPPAFVEWNAQWGAPFGPEWGYDIPFEQRFTSQRARQLGLFAFQPNNTTRRVEYPWAFQALDIKPGSDVVDIGGALSGLQFVLDRCGANVTNVDPFRDYWWSSFYPVEPEILHARLNQYFDTGIVLKRADLTEAGLDDESFDRAVCLSTIEHLSDDDITRTIQEVYRILRKGALFVLTVDLFINLFPFTPWERNKCGTNVSIQRLVEQSNMGLIYGERKELFGFREFDPERILSNLKDYYIGAEYPALAQMFVLRK